MQHSRAKWLHKVVLKQDPSKGVHNCARISARRNPIFRMMRSVIVGERAMRQLRDDLGAAGWTLTSDQIMHLDKASAVMPAYPYRLYRNGFARLHPPPA